MKVNVPISYKYWHRNKERNQCQQTNKHTNKQVICVAEPVSMLTPQMI